MMKIAVRIDTNAAIRAGINAAGVRVIEFDPVELAQPEREILAAKTATDVRGGDFASTSADIYLVYGPGPTLLTAPTLECLRAALAEGIGQRRAEAESNERSRIAKLAQDAAQNAELASRPVAKLIKQGWTDAPWELVQQFGYPERYPLLATRREEAQTEVDRRNAEQKAGKEAARLATAQAQAETAARVKAAKEALAAWCREHGSALAKARLNHGYECWFSEARANYTDSITAVASGTLFKGQDDKAFDVTIEDRKCPALNELRTLDAATERAKTVSDPNATIEVSLKRLAYTPEEKEDGYDTDDEEFDTTYRTELCVAVTLFGLWRSESFFAVPE